MIATGDRRNPAVELAEQVDAFARAFHLQLAARWTLRAIIVGLFLDTLAAVGLRFGTVPSPMPWLALPPIALALVTLIVLAARRPAPAALARHTDRALGLHERLTTAVELRARRSDSPLADLQLADTLSHLRRARPSQAFPMRVDRRELGLAVLGMLATLLILTLPSPEQVAPDQARVPQVVKQEAERILAVAEEIATTSDTADKVDRAAIAKALQEASENLAKQEGSAEKAVAVLAEARQQLSNLQNPRGEDIRQAIASAAQALQRDGATRAAGEGLAKGDAAGAAEALRQLGEGAQSMSAEDRASAAQALANAANAAGRSDAALGQSLGKAAEALAAGGEQAQAAISQSAEALQQAGQATAGQDSVEKALAQLERSQAAVASTAQPSSVERSGQGSGRTASSASQAVPAGQRSQPTARGEQSGGRAQAGAQGVENGELGTTGGSSRAQSSTEEGEQASGNGEGGERADGGESGEPGSGGAGAGSQNNSGAIFDPRLSNSHQEQDVAPGFEQPSVSASDRTGLSDHGQATVDYREVYSSYRDQATAAVQDRYIPLDLKDLVKSYFSSLDPSQ